MEIRILAVGEYVTHAGHGASIALNAQFQCDSRYTDLLF